MVEPNNLHLQNLEAQPYQLWQNGQSPGHAMQQNQAPPVAYQRPIARSVPTIPDNSYNDIDEQHLQSLGRLSQHQRLVDQQLLQQKNDAADFNNKNMHFFNVEKANVGGGVAARYDGQGSAIFANSTASLQPYQSQDGGSDNNLGFGQSSSHYSDPGGLNGQMRGNRSSEHIQNIR